MSTPRISAPGGGPEDLADWLARQRKVFDDLLAEHGALFVTGLPIDTPADVAVAGNILLGPRMRPAEQDVPRTDRGAGIYTTEDGPAGDPSCLHQRYSYTARFPGRVLSACLTGPDLGGEILLGDTRKILENVPPPLVERLRSSGWLLSRTYLDDVGVRWQDALGADRRVEAARLLRRNEISGTWDTGGRLSTVQRRPALATHPVTGEQCWFNDILYYSRWSNEPEVRELLVETYGPDRLPFDTRFGDGTDCPKRTPRPCGRRTTVRRSASLGKPVTCL